MLVQIATVTPDIEGLIIIAIPQGLAKVATLSSSSSHFLLLLLRRSPGADCAVRYKELFCTIWFPIGRSIYIQENSYLKETKNEKLKVTLAS